MVKDESGLPERFFLPHLREMTTERGKYKKDKGNPSSQILEKLLIPSISIGGDTAARICREDLNEVIATFVQDKTTIERGLFDDEPFSISPSTIH